MELDLFLVAEDPEVIDGPSRCYRFVGDSTLGSRRYLVINHRLQMTRPFSAGESVRAFCWVSVATRFPQSLVEGKMIPSFLVLYDQFASPYRAPVVALGRSNHEKSPAAAIERKTEGKTAR